MKSLTQLAPYLTKPRYTTLFVLIISLIVFFYLSAFLDWALLNATWLGESRKDCQGQGACWALISARWEQFIYGFYPASQRWRINFAFILLGFGFIILSLLKVTLSRRVFFLVATIITIVYLLHGGNGLQVVPTNLWGGLFLTIFLAFGSMVCAFPLAILLALGRSSSLVLIKGACIAYIEIIRGVPLITILFMATVMSPLLLPQDLVLDKLFCAFLGITIFAAAYLAEVIRGGLNTLPKGQREAAFSLGMGYWQTMGLIVLPQALRAVIPGIVNNFIALFKDTTLVLIVGIYDFLGMVQLAITSPQWLGSTLEAYLFCALVYWLVCFSMSFFSKHLEKKLGIGSF